MRIKIAFAIFLMILSGVILSFFIEHKDQYITHTIANPTGDSIPSLFLWETMGLSEDEPLKNNTSLRFLKQKLLKLPCMEEAKLYYVDSTTLGIDYTLRKPIAHLSVYHNVCIDKYGKKFPFYPFYSPKTIPELYCNEEEFDQVFPIYLNLLAYIKCFPESLARSVTKIDLSRGIEKTKGKQEIVIEMKEHNILGVHHYLLRCTPKKLEEQMGNFVSLHKQIRRVYPHKISKIIDMRIASTAYLQDYVPKRSSIQ